MKLWKEGRRRKGEKGSGLEWKWIVRWSNDRRKKSVKQREINTENRESKKVERRERERKGAVAVENILHHFLCFLHFIFVFLSPSPGSSFLNNPGPHLSPLSSCSLSRTKPTFCSFQLLQYSLSPPEGQVLCCSYCVSLFKLLSPSCELDVDVSGASEWVFSLSFSSSTPVLKFTASCRQSLSWTGLSISWFSKEWERERERRKCQKKEKALQTGIWKKVNKNLTEWLTQCVTIRIGINRSTGQSINQ